VELVQAVNFGSTVCLFVCLFGDVSKAGEIRTLSKTSLPVAALRVAKGPMPYCLSWFVLKLNRWSEHPNIYGSFVFGSLL
jgi:hypothetical protein